MYVERTERLRIAATYAPHSTNQPLFSEARLPCPPLVARHAGASAARSFIGDVSFQGMERRLHLHRESVTYVPGPFCHLCTRSEPTIVVDGFCGAPRLPGPHRFRSSDCCADMTRDKPSRREIDFEGLRSLNRRAAGD
jgi:hypothetical protein